MNFNSGVGFWGQDDKAGLVAALGQRWSPGRGAGALSLLAAACWVTYRAEPWGTEERLGLGVGRSSMNLLATDKQPGGNGGRKGEDGETKTERNSNQEPKPGKR